MQRMVIVLPFLTTAQHVRHLQISLPLVEMLLDGRKYFRPDELAADEQAGGVLPRGAPPMKNDHHDSSQSAVELRRLALMRQATSAASSRTNAAGVEKVRGPKPRPVTLPSQDALKKIGLNDE